MNYESHDYQRLVLEWGWKQRVQPFPAAASQVILICLMVLGVREDNKLYGSGMWRDEWLGVKTPKHIGGWHAFKKDTMLFSLTPLLAHPLKRGRPRFFLTEVPPVTTACSFRQVCL